ncbi:MAG TPA: hypothetical protein DCS43_05460 [Verrucomicrobia bacterium]|nr:hypothetical protein [Verrucomicrobiota bacterium]
MKMKIISGLVAMMMVASTAVFGADASLSLDMASAYVFRGVTYNDGLVAHPGVKASGLNGLTVGTWGVLNLDDYDGAVAKNQFSEVDLYGSYTLPIEVVGVSIGYTEYVYPTAAADSDREASLGLSKSAGPIDLAATAYYMVDGPYRNQLYSEVTAGTLIELGAVGLKLGALVAYLAPDEGDSGFSHYLGTAGLTFGPVSASVTYIGQIDDKVLSDDAYDTEVVGTVGVSVAL